MVSLICTKPEIISMQTECLKMMDAQEMLSRIPAETGTIFVQKKEWMNVYILLIKPVFTVFSYPTVFVEPVNNLKHSTLFTCVQNILCIIHYTSKAINSQTTNSEKQQLKWHT